MKIYFGSLAEAMEVAYGPPPLKVSEETIERLSRIGKFNAAKGVPTEEIRDEAKGYIWNFLEALSKKKIWDVGDSGGEVTMKAFEAIERNKDIPQKPPNEKAYIACGIWRNKYVDYVRRNSAKEKRRKKWMEKSARALQRGGINAMELRQWFEEHRKQARGTLREALDDIADKYGHSYTDEEIAAKRGLSQDTIRARRSEVSYAHLRKKASEEELILSDFVDEYFC
jgi:hypothetical protein